MRVFSFFLCAWAVVSLGAAETGLIMLDAICRPGEVRNPPLPVGNRPPSNIKMAELLAKLAAQAKPESMAYFSDVLAESLAKMTANETNATRKLNLQYSLSLQQMRAGRPDFALNTMAEMERTIADGKMQLDQLTRERLRMRKAVAYLRLGEQENCIANHNAESCLFPLSTNATHRLKRGAQMSIGVLKQQLADYPEDHGAKWLLNIAHMALGEWPEKVEPRFLIPPRVFASESEMPRFPDIADKLGLGVEDLAGGVIVDDFDNDNFLDVVASSWDLRGQMRYFKNNGNGTFTQRTSEAGLVGLTSGLNLQQTDYNNDGWLDIFVMRGGWLGKAGRFPNSLLRNNGDGTFTDVTEEAGLLSFHPTQTCEWFDFDGDGWLDVFIGNESTDKRDPDRCELYRNNGNGTFTNIAEAAGVAMARYVKGVAAGDINNDGRPDLYLSCRDGASVLLRNDGPSANGWRFTDVTLSSWTGGPTPSFPAWFFDYDNDGWDDLFCSGYSGSVGDFAADYLGLPNKSTHPKMYRNNGNGTFSDMTAPLKLDRVCHTMGCNFGDLENDGWLDFYCATGDPEFTSLVPNRMFRNNGGKGFQEVTTATGTGHLQKGHGVAFADMDNDGDQDVYVVMGGAYSGDVAKNALFSNPISTNGWLKLKLVGAKANRAAIGAKVKVTLKTPEGARALHRTVSHGASFGANPLRLEIGLGDAKEIEAVEIRWPGSGTVQKFEGLALNSAYTIRENQAAPERLTLKRLDFAAAK